MRSRNLVASFGISIAITIAVAGAASGDGLADCVRDAATADLVAKTEFQRDLRDLVVQQRPEFEPLATVNQELQVLLAEAQRAKFDYLLSHEPGRIDTSNGLARFSNFAWSDEDTAKFIEQSASFRDLEVRIAALQDQNNDHPDWPGLREHFRAGLSQSADFVALMARFQARQSDVEAAIAKCRRN